MSKWKMTVVVEIDDEALAEHPGDREAPPNDVEEWYGRDLLDAVDAGLAEIEHSQIEEIERISGG